MAATIFLLAALILFIVAALGASSRINLTAAGLACLATSMLITNGTFG